MMNTYQHSHQENMGTKKFSKFFPGKLRTMLDSVPTLGLSHGISWVSDGCAFAIHDPNVYMAEIAPRFFRKQTHLRSFHRQLSIWGFTRLETGAGGRGVWFHKYFIQAKPELIARIKRVPVKQTNEPRPTESDLSSNPTMDYTNYKLNDKVAKVIATSSATSYHMDSLLNKSKAKRPSLPMRRRSNSDDSEDSAPPRVSAATTSGHPAGILSAGMMQPQTSLQRLYAQNAATASAAQLTGSNASRLPPLILTSYQPAAAANARLLPQGYPTPGSFLTGATAPTLAAATANPPHVEDELVARQLAAMGRPAHTLSAAAAAPRPSLVTNDAAVMARAMVLESERRRQAALVQAQAAQAAQAAHAHAQAQAQAAQAQALGAAMPPTSMGSDADILAAIQQRQRFLSRLESEFKAKIGPRGA